MLLWRFASRDHSGVTGEVVLKMMYSSCKPTMPGIDEDDFNNTKPLAMVAKVQPKWPV